MDRSLRPRLVPVWELRRYFNDNRFEERVAQGEFALEVYRDRHPSHPSAPVPLCTRSQIVLIRDSAGHEVAKAHRYLREDGTLGASGRLDPKQLRVGDELWRPDDTPT